MTATDGNWTMMVPESLIDTLVARASPDVVAVVGVNGRSRSGKTTLAGLLATAREHIAVVHTYDVAWHHSFFDWPDVLIDGLLDPLRRNGTAVPRADAVDRTR